MLVVDATVVGCDAALPHAGLAAHVGRSAPSPFSSTLQRHADSTLAKGRACAPALIGWLPLREGQAWQALLRRPQVPSQPWLLPP
mmetsp:Transcript_17958/g.42972  ORF Transcript_17958/g.42972 Transcript_17958/m.42972 type:complete len:85 (-) Transcript_17958:279-533(-)